MTERVASASGAPSPVLLALLCVFLVVGLIQVIRPQLLWRLNRRLQRGWVKDPDATEPTRKAYAMQRATGVVFLAVVVWMLFRHI
ncbi:DUF6199 family natural product biosynthesis protein [Streptomyces sp. NPDC005438]|uniref:DUF6199 family natural product biosynthesis protein n=1 Tax=Streptomyces sp. NPDC005438 TaxID=3156880 RepID=UPI0033BD6F1B